MKSKFNILFEQIMSNLGKKSNFKYSIGQQIYVAINKNYVLSGIIIKRCHKRFAEVNVEYYAIQFNNNMSMQYPVYRLGKTEQQALLNLKQFNTSLANEQKK